MYFWFFFFQAEDGIRDLYVTGVQTCALPISDRGETALCRPLTEHLRQRHRLGDAFERARSKIAIVEPVAGEAPGRRGDDDAAGRCFGLQPRRQIGSLADHGVGFAAADFADHDQAGGDADAGAEPYAPPVEAGYGFRDL